MVSSSRLHPTLIRPPGENPLSFASRLAKLHLSNSGNARVFCSDMAISWSDLVSGRSRALTDLAELAGADPISMAVDAISRVESGYLFRGELFPRASLRRTSLRFCPACLADDCSQATKPELAVYGRTVWSISSIRTCPTHSIGIVDLAQASPSTHHDFALLVTPFLLNLEIHIEAAPRRGTALETYIVARLGGISGQAAWLDELPLHVAITMSETIGIVDCFGRDVQTKRLTNDDWAIAAERGFDIARRGIPAFEAFMDELLRTYPYSRRCTERAQATLGYLYQILAFRTPHPDFNAVRDLVANFVVRRMPYGAGEMIFGKEVARRELHSVHTASQEFQVHPKRLHKVLHAAGIISQQQLEMPYGNATFDAEASADVLRDVADGLFMTEIEAYLGTSRTQMKILVDCGLIKPMFQKRADLDHLFRRRDLDQFLERLFVDAVSVEEPEVDMVDIATAKSRVRCGTIEIVNLILQRRFSWVGRRSNKHGFAALLVRLSESKTLVRGSMDGWLTARAIEKAMHTDTTVVRNLIDGGHLKAEIIVSPLNRCPVSVVRQDLYEEFRRDYVTLFDLMERTGIHFRKLQKILAERGIDPHIKREEVGASFYRTRDIEGI